MRLIFAWSHFPDLEQGSMMAEVSYLNKLKRQKSESEKMRHWNLWGIMPDKRELLSEGTGYLC